MKLFLILAGIIIVVIGSQYYLDSPTAATTCAADPLPSCAELSRSGSYVTVVNNCEFDIALQWEFLAGSNQIHHLSQGETKRVSTFPVKVDAVSCCPEHNRCW